MKFHKRTPSGITARMESGESFRASPQISGTTAKALDGEYPQMKPFRMDAAGATPGTLDGASRSSGRTAGERASAPHRRGAFACKAAAAALLAAFFAGEARAQRIPGLHESRFGWHATWDWPAHTKARVVAGPAGIDANSNADRFNPYDPSDKIWPPPTSLYAGWTDNSTFAYTGFIRIPEGSNTVTFAMSFDDTKRMLIDGETLINSGEWNAVPHSTVTLTTGWHRIEIWGGQGGGGFGPNNWGDNTLGAGIDWQGRNANTRANFTALYDPGDGSLVIASAPPGMGSVTTLPATDVGAAYAVLPAALSFDPDDAGELRVFYGLAADALTESAAYGAVALSGEYGIALNGLAVDTQYHYRHALISASGAATNWAAQTLAFTTSVDAPPALETPSASGVTKVAATLNGVMSAGRPVTTVTACLDTQDCGEGSDPADWAKSATVGLYDLHGEFSAAFSGLTASTDYVGRFFASNALGTAWSAPVAFTTAAPALSSRDQYVHEGDGGKITAVTIPLTADMAGGKPMSFHWATVKPIDPSFENAQPGVNYIHGEGDIVMPPGATSTNITVRIIGNNRDEFPGKHFRVEFSAATNAAAPGSVEVGILDDDMGRIKLYDDFSDSNADGWILSGARWWGAAGYLRWGHGGGQGVARRDFTSGLREFGLRTMQRSDGSWQPWAIHAYFKTPAGAQRDYRFWMKGDGASPTAIGARVYADGVFAAGFNGDNYLGGSRIGHGGVFRPISLRVSKTPEGFNRVCAWAGCMRIADWVDENAGAGLDGVGVGLEGNEWANFDFTSVTVFDDHPYKFSLLFLR